MGRVLRAGTPLEVPGPAAVRTAWQNGPSPVPEALEARFRSYGVESDWLRAARAFSAQDSST